MTVEEELNEIRAILSTIPAAAGDRNGRIENLLAATEKRDAAMETLKGQWHVYIKTLPRK
jgi:hypothetical protein